MAHIDYSKLRSLTARTLMKALEEDEFRLVRTKGAHHRYRHPDGRRVTVSFHRSGDTYKQGTLNSMIELQAKWTVEDLERLELIE